MHGQPLESGLVIDPLAWPWSTHRERTGFAWPPFLPMATDPAAFHRATATHAPGRSFSYPMPSARLGATWDEVAEAASSVVRELPSAVHAGGCGRDLAVRAAYIHGVATPEIEWKARLGRGECEDLVFDLSPGLIPADPGVAAVVRAAGDPRFPALSDVDHRRLPSWQAYSDRYDLSPGLELDVPPDLRWAPEEAPGPPDSWN